MSKTESLISESHCYHHQTYGGDHLPYPPRAGNKALSHTYSSQLFCSLYFVILLKQKINTWYLKRE